MSDLKRPSIITFLRSLNKESTNRIKISQFVLFVGIQLLYLVGAPAGNDMGLMNLRRFGVATLATLLCVSCTAAYPGRGGVWDSRTIRYSSTGQATGEQYAIHNEPIAESANADILCLYNSRTLRHVDCSHEVIAALSRRYDLQASPSETLYTLVNRILYKTSGVRPEPELRDIIIKEYPISNKHSQLFEALDILGEHCNYRLSIVNAATSGNSTSFVVRALKNNDEIISSNIYYYNHRLSIVEPSLTPLGNGKGFGLSGDLSVCWPPEICPEGDLAIKDMQISRDKFTSTPVALRPATFVSRDNREGCQGTIDISANLPPSWNDITSLRISGVFTIKYIIGYDILTIQLPNEREVKARAINLSVKNAVTVSPGAGQAEVSVYVDGDIAEAIELDDLVVESGGAPTAIEGLWMSRGRRRAILSFCPLPAGTAVRYELRLRKRWLELNIPFTFECSVKAK
jgi:hypothetical protein